MLKGKITFVILIFLFSRLDAQKIPSYIPTDGLVTWYPFNGNGNDESGNGNNGTVNDVSLTTDRFNNMNRAYNFNGNSFIQIKPSKLFDISTGTFSCWIYKEDSKNNDAIFSIRNDVHNTRFSIHTVNNNLGIGVYNGNSFEYITYNLSNLEWFNITVVFNSTFWKLYINGILIGNMNQSIGTSKENNVWIGQADNTAQYFNERWKGKIDDIGLWNRTLTDNEIRELYNSKNSTRGEISIESPKLNRITERSLDSLLSPEFFFENINNPPTKIFTYKEYNGLKPVKISASCVYKNELYIAGNFRGVDNTNCKGVAKYDGSNWIQVGNINDESIYSLIEFKEELYVAGSEGGIKKWNGKNWIEFGKDVKDITLRSFCVYKNELYACGIGIWQGGALLKWNENKWKIIQPWGYVDGGFSSMVVYKNAIYLSSYEGFSEDKTHKRFALLKYNGEDFKGVEMQYPNGFKYDIGVTQIFASETGIYLMNGNRVSESGGIIKWDGASTKVVISNKTCRNLLPVKNGFIAATYQSKVAFIENDTVKKWFYLPRIEENEHTQYDYPYLLIYKNNLFYSVNNTEDYKKANSNDLNDNLSTVNSNSDKISVSNSSTTKPTNSPKGLEFLKYFQGTFASTPRGDMWVKITIKDRKISVWHTIPSNGSWGRPQNCEIKEYPGCLICTARDNNDGSKYYTIDTDGCESSTPFFLNFTIKYIPSQRVYKFIFGLSTVYLSKVAANYSPWN